MSEQVTDKKEFSVFNARVIKTKTSTNKDQMVYFPVFFHNILTYTKYNIYKKSYAEQLYVLLFSWHCQRSFWDLHT